MSVRAEICSSVDKTNLFSNRMTAARRPSTDFHMRLLIRREERIRREQCVRGMRRQTGSHRRSTKFDKFIAREMVLRSADAIPPNLPLCSALGVRRSAPRIMSYLCDVIVATQLQHIVAAILGSVSLTRCRQLFTFPLSALSSVGRAGLLTIGPGPPERAAAQPKMCQPLFGTRSSWWRAATISPSAKLNCDRMATALSMRIFCDIRRRAERALSPPNGVRKSTMQLPQFTIVISFY